MVMMRLTILLFLFITILTNNVHAVMVVESTDFSGGVSVGLLDLGNNTISGSLMGNCIPGGSCNAGNPGEDTQDSFLIEIGNNMALDNVMVTTSNVSGPSTFTAAFAANTTTGPFTILLNEPSLQVNGTTGNLVLFPLGAGIYAFNIFGGFSPEPGPFALDWSINANVSAVPVPSAILLMGSGLAGLALWRVRQKA